MCTVYSAEACRRRLREGLATTPAPFPHRAEGSSGLPKCYRSVAQPAISFSIFRSPTLSIFPGPTFPRPQMPPCQYELSSGIHEEFQPWRVSKEEVSGTPSVSGGRCRRQPLSVGTQLTIHTRGPIVISAKWHCSPDTTAVASHRTPPGHCSGQQQWKAKGHLS